MMRSTVSLKTTMAILLILLGMCSCSPGASDGREGPAEAYAVTVSVETESDFLGSISDLRGLSVGEVQLLMGFILRHELGALSGSRESGLVGMTIGEMIEAQRNQMAEQEQLAEQEEQLAVDARAEEDARARLLRETIALTVYEKSFLEADFEDYIQIKCSYENKSEKEIRGFQGVVRFSDIFGDLIYQSGIKIADPVGPGAKGFWTGGIDYNQFMDDHKALRNTALNDMKVEWIPVTIIFADGTVLGED